MESVLPLSVWKSSHFPRGADDIIFYNLSSPPSRLIAFYLFCFGLGVTSLDAGFGCFTLQPHAAGLHCTAAL